MYVDSTYMSEEKTACRFGVVFMINMCCVLEISRRMLDIALSSTEAEYIALTIGAQEGYYLRQVLEALNEPQSGPLLVGQDNKSCIQIAENPGRHHGRTKHIDVRIRWIEREIEKGRLALVYVNTKYMVADIMTKPMSTYESHARHTEVIKGQKLPEKEKPKGRRKKRKVSEIET